jgi:Holliday junction DNA helicase RuvA
MIGFLAGTLAHKTAERLLLEVSGVGYELAASTRTLASLGAVSEELMLYTHLHVRENEVSLYGFIDEEEKRAFCALIEVSGVGPKVALAVLSSLSPQMLANALLSEDVALLSSVPGIGKKTAQRLIIDLKGKLAGVLPDGGQSAGTTGAATAAGVLTPGGEPSPFAEAQAALFSMGFSAAEIAEALAGAEADDSTEALLKHALGRMGRQGGHS